MIGPGFELSAPDVVTVGLWGHLKIKYFGFFHQKHYSSKLKASGINIK